MKRKSTSDEHDRASSSSKRKSQKLESSQGQGDSTPSPIELPDSSACSSSNESADLRNDKLISLDTKKYMSTKKPKVKADSAPIEEPNNKKRAIVVPIPSDAKQGDIIYISDKQFNDAKVQIAFKVPSKKYYMSAGKSKKSIHYIKVILPMLSSKLSSRKEVHAENQLQHQSPPCQCAQREGVGLPSSDSKVSKSKDKSTEIHLSHKSPPEMIQRRGDRIRRTPQEGEEKRYERGFRSKISIGPQYQVDPMQIPNPNDLNPSPPLAELCEQIWAPDISCTMPQTIREGTNYLLKALPPNQKQIMMEELYKCNYDVPSAMHAFSERLCGLKAQGELPGEKLPKEIETLFFKTIWETRKNIVAATKTVQKKFKISTCSLLVHYYNHYKPSEEYSKLKEIKKGESDYCLICDDGGVLICCDECSGTYHLDCLDPPLKSIPDDKWYCPNCVQAAVTKKLRAQTRKVGPGKVSTSIGTTKSSKSKKSNVDPTWTYWGLNRM